MDGGGRPLIQARGADINDGSRKRSLVLACRDQLFHGIGATLARTLGYEPSVIIFNVTSVAATTSRIKIHHIRPETFRRQGGEMGIRSSSNPGNRSLPAEGVKGKDTKHHAGCVPKTLHVVGIGPGGMMHMSGRAVSVLQSVEAITGYTTYIDLIRPLITEKQSVFSTGMKKEKERVHSAIQTARQGRSCALVSSGDPGVYAMAGLVFEICRPLYLSATTPRRPILSIWSLPGDIPTSTTCAAGATSARPSLWMRNGINSTHRSTGRIWDGKMIRWKWLPV